MAQRLLCSSARHAYYLPGGRVARLSDIAEVRDGVAEIRSVSRLNGRHATTFGVFRSKGSSDVTVLDLVTREIDKIGKEFPQVKLKVVFTTVDYTKRMFSSAMEALIEGSILAVAVVWFFLRDWRATAISALAIPLSAIPTFAFMQWMGFTLNQVSLLALSLVAGVLVDDAIVEIENIVRHMRMGKTGYKAALDAADEIGLAVVATSATIIAVFLPVSFMPGIIGQYFIQFGLTVAAAVFFSLLVARLITPVIAAYTLKSDSLKAHGDGPIMTWYLKTLRWCVNHRWRTLAGGTVFFMLSLVVLSMVPTSFVPEADLASSQLNIELPPGRSARRHRGGLRCGVRRPQATAGSDRRRRMHRRRRDRRGAHRQPLHLAGAARGPQPHAAGVGGSRPQGAAAEFRTRASTSRNNRAAATGATSPST